MTIDTERLTLLPATLNVLRAELKGHDAFAEEIGHKVPDNWPPQFYDHDAIHYTIDRLEADPGSGPWWLYYIVLRSEGRVIGTAGYKGKPDESGTVEIGYGILEQYQRQGIASEAARGLIAHAFRNDGVRRVVAETYPELVGSIGVLRRCGFVAAGPGSEEGTIRFELVRE